MLTNGAIGLGVFFTGDVLSQVAADRDVIDYSRATKTGLLGVVMNGGASIFHIYCPSLFSSHPLMSYLMPSAQWSYTDGTCI